MNTKEVADAALEAANDPVRHRELMDADTDAVDQSPYLKYTGAYDPTTLVCKPCEVERAQKILDATSEHSPLEKRVIDAFRKVMREDPTNGSKETEQLATSKHCLCDGNGKRLEPTATERLQSLEADVALLKETIRRMELVRENADHEEGERGV